MRLLVLIVCGMLGGVAEAATVSVPDGGDLQAALNAANPGDTILLQPGATYVGNFVLPAKDGASFITLQTSGSSLPGAGVRISPADAPSLAKLRSPNGASALRTAPGAHHWRIVLVEFLANAEGAGDIIALGDWHAQNTLAAVPHDLVIDRCYIHAAPGSPQKRGIALNSASTTVTGSYIADIKSDGQDSQAIAGWNGPGPYTITNNYLEAAGENVMFGGGDPAIPNLVPSDITISNNVFSKPVAWRTENWVVKNLFELKNARRVTIQNNTFEYNWDDAQSGFAILFTVRNQDGGCAWCQVEDVLFERNIVRHAAAGINILGFDDIENHPSLQTRGITIRDSLFDDIDPVRWGGNGYFLQLLGGPADITVDHNTIIQDNAFGVILAEGPPIQGFRFTNNLVRHGAYGIIGTDHGSGSDTIAAYFPDAVISNNVIADANPAAYPTANLFPSSDEFRSNFVSYTDGDYRLVAHSAWRGAGSDGEDLGASFGDPVPVVTGDRRVDLNGDGNGDAFLYNAQTGAWASEIAGPSGAGFGHTTSTWDAGWQVYPANLDGDAYTDIFLYDPLRGLWVQARNSAGDGTFIYTVGTWDRNWQIYPADLDGNGLTDVFVYNATTGVWVKCFVDGAGGFAAYTARQWDAGWSFTTADLNDDGRDDFFLYNRSSGVWVEAFSHPGAGSFDYAASGRWDLGWEIYPADLNGDGRSDLFLYNAAGVRVGALSREGGDFDYPVVGSWDAGWTIAPAELNGDDRTDLFLYNAVSGVWVEAFSDGSGDFTYAVGQWDPGWQVNITDFNEDGVSDVLVHNIAGTWVQAVNTGTGTFSYAAGNWGPGWASFTRHAKWR